MSKEQNKKEQTPTSAEKENPTEAPKGDRLNKFVAKAGICSRRKADEFIKQGFVKVNDTVVKEMGYRVKPEDVIKFKDKVIEAETNMVYVLMNKPKNYVTTVKDERGRKTVMDIVQGVCKERIYPVGRLDRATTGLLLMTNDGDLAQKLSHPSHGVKKIYHVTLEKAVTNKHLDLIRAGLTLEDGKAVVDKVNHLQGRDKREVGIEIHIGKNRIVRRIFEHLGYEVKKLDRVYYGGLTKKDLQRGWHRFLTEREVIMLKHFS